MKKKIIINESQLKRLVNTLNEAAGDVRKVLVNQIKDDLDKNYEPQVITKRSGGEYFEDGGFVIKADGTITDGKGLYKYLSMKYDDVGKKFLKQVIIDWADDSIDDGMLTTNVTVDE
jgi:hypothetical protein